MNGQSLVRILCGAFQFQPNRALLARNWDHVVTSILGVNLAVALNATALYYLFPFSQSTSEAPLWIRSIDEVVVIGSLSMLAALVVRQRNPQLITGPLRGHWGARMIAALIGLMAVATALFMLSQATMPLAYRIAKTSLLVSWLGLLILTQRGNALTSLLRMCGLVIIVSAVVQLGFSMMVSAATPDYALWKDDPFDGYVPYTGFILNPNRFGLLLNVALGIFLALLCAGKGVRANSMLTCGCILFNFAIVRTGALSQLIVSFGLLFYFVLILFIKRSTAALAGLFVLLASVLLFVQMPGPFSAENACRNTVMADLRERVTGDNTACPQSTSDSTSRRLADMKNVARMFSEAKPLTLMFGNFVAREHVHAHGDLWLILLQTGLVGFAVFCVPLLGAGVASIRAFITSEQPQAAAYRLAVHLALACFAATFIVDNVIFDATTGLLFIVSLGFGLALTDRSTITLPNKSMGTVSP